MECSFKNFLVGRKGIIVWENMDVDDSELGVV